MSKNPRHPLMLIVLALAFIVIAGGAGLIARLTHLTQNTAIPAGTPSGELAFIGDRDGKWNVFLMDESGSLRNLTEAGNSNDFFVSWDFKSERLNFISDQTGEMGPVQVQPDGTGLRTLSMVDAVTTMFFEGRLDWDPQWSPDGKKLLWSSLRDLNLELYQSNADGSERVRLTNTPARDWYGAWSPDGMKIAFTSERNGSEDVYVMNADGSDLRQITTNPADDLHPAWSLDGKTVLFVSERENPLSSEVMDFYAVPFDGDEDAVRKLEAGAVWEGDPIWSADSRSMVYVSNQDGKWSLYQRDTENGETRRLTDGTFNALFPVWRP